MVAVDGERRLVAENIHAQLKECLESVGAVAETAPTKVLDLT